MATVPHPTDVSPFNTRSDRPDALASLTTTRAGRWLVPSLTDLLFIAFFVWLFVAGSGGWNGFLADGDTGWHIRTGEFILDHHAVPQTDLFSFTRPGAPWFAWEWLCDVLFAIAHRWCGLKGVVLIAGTVIAVWPVLLLRQALWRGAHLWVALAATLPGVGAASIHFLARPHVFTLLFTTVCVWMVESDRRSPGWRLWLLVPVTAVWTNLHGGFLLLIGLLGLTALGSAAEAWAGVGGWKDARRYAMAATACAGASLVNPYGIGLHTHILQYLRSDWIRNVVQEFKAPDFRSESQLQYEALLMAGLAAATLLILRRRYVHALWLLAMAHLSLTSLRHVPIYVAVAAPILAEVYSELWTSAARKSRKNSTLFILDRIGIDAGRAFQRTSLWLVGFVLAYSMVTSAAKWPRDFPTTHFPTTLVHSHRDILSTGRVLTMDQWGDYLIYSFYPSQRVFADGRSDFYGPELGNEYLLAVGGDYRWRQTLDRYGVDTVLAPVSWALATILKSDPAWRVIADDGKAILFVRRKARNL